MEDEHFNTDKLYRDSLLIINNSLRFQPKISTIRSIKPIPMEDNTELFEDFSDP
jgi:hypothetical protein